MQVFGLVHCASFDKNEKVFKNLIVSVYTADAWLVTTPQIIGGRQPTFRDKHDGEPKKVEQTKGNAVRRASLRPY